MTKSAGGAVRNGLVLRFSVPASGDIAVVGREMASKLAEQLGIDAARLRDAVSDLVRQIEPSDADDVALEFHKLDTELKIEARQGDRASEARIPLAA